MTQSPEQSQSAHQVWSKIYGVPLWTSLFCVIGYVFLSVVVRYFDQGFEGFGESFKFLGPFKEESGSVCWLRGNFLGELAVVIIWASRLSATTFVFYWIIKSSEKTIPYGLAVAVLPILLWLIPAGTTYHLLATKSCLDENGLSFGNSRNKWETIKRIDLIFSHHTKHHSNTVDYHTYDYDLEVHLVNGEKVSRTLPRYIADEHLDIWSDALERYAPQVLALITRNRSHLYKNASPSKTSTEILHEPR